MTCIDCIKYDACVVYNGGMTRTMSMKNKAEEMCELFKNKADFVEVVKCEDCKYKDNCLKTIDCDYQYREIDFCSYGERRDT